MSVILDLFSNNETPVGDINGTNKVFTIDHLPDPEASLELFVNGKFQVLDDDFTIDDKNVTFSVAPLTGSILKINYRYIDAERLYLTISKILGAGALAGKDKADFDTEVEGAEKPDDNATKNEGALADKDIVDTSDIATNAISAVKISAGAVTVNKIATNAVTASKISAGAVTAIKIGANAITADKINAGAVDTSELAAGAVTADKIEANAVTASKINVSTLSAISANIGTITAGTITGLTITGGTLQTHSASNTGVKMTSGGLVCYGTAMYLRNTSGGLACTFQAAGGGSADIEAVGELGIAGNGVMIGGFLNIEDGFDCYGEGRVDSLRIDQTPASGTITPDKIITISCNGTNYKIAVKAA